MADITQERYAEIKRLSDVDLSTLFQQHRAIMSNPHAPAPQRDAANKEMGAIVEIGKQRNLEFN